MHVYIGVDWSEDKYDVVFMNQAGVDVARLTIPHSLDGYENSALRRTSVRSGSRQRTT